MNQKLKFLSPALLPAGLIAAAWMLLTYESDMLWKAQELNLFLDTPLFFQQQTVTSGWLLTWLGTWFTEFFYHPWQGVMLLLAWWALLMWLAARAFRIPAKWALVLAIPVAALLASDVQQGYWLYYQKLRGYFFAATIGSTVAVSSVWLFRMLPSRWWLRPVYVVLSCGVLYVLTGFYGLLATLLAAVITWRLTDTDRTQRIVTTAVALLSIAGWPLLCYRYVFCQTSMADIFYTGLPSFAADKSYPEYFAPFVVLALSLLVMAATYRRQRQTEVVRPVWWLAIQLLLAAAIVMGVNHCWYKDYNYHKELKMMRCMEQLDWEGMRAEGASLDDEPTRAIVVMRNLALFRLGVQGSTMYHYRTGGKACDAPFPVAMTQVVGVPLYYHYGQYNFSYRWCMEFGVELGWRAEYLKYMTRSALVAGDLRVAGKYIEQLRHTRFHGEWADRYARLAANSKALHADPEFVPIFHLAASDDFMSSDATVIEKFLMTQFANRNSSDPLFHEQAVYAALWTKDIATFWRCFFRYANSHIGQPMPTHLQEAAYLYGHLEHNVDISHMPFDQHVINSYNELMQQARQYEHLGEEGMANALYARFGNTFYYDYYFVRNLFLY